MGSVCESRKSYAGREEAFLRRDAPLTHSRRRTHRQFKISPFEKRALLYLCNRMTEDPSTVFHPVFLRGFRPSSLRTCSKLTLLPLRARAIMAQNLGLRSKR